jgi:outer membrane lipoprotein-sorting protein
MLGGIYQSYSRRVCMAGMVRFMETAKQTIVFVNPDLVRVVTANPDEGIDIIFGDGHRVTVVGEAEKVATRLDDAK